MLLAWRDGDAQALDRLIPLVHAELHRIAKRCMHGERAGHSLQATAVVNEAYVKLMGAQHINWHDRAHFLAMAARIMRRVLVDHARSRAYSKRGGAAQRVTLTEGVFAPDEQPREVLALNDALDALAAMDVRKAQVVELRFFGGLAVDETAHVLGVSPQTVMRDWQFARAWLRRELGAPEPDPAHRRSSHSD